MIARPILEPELNATQLVASAGIGVACLYQCVIGFRCFSHLNTVFVLHDSGLDLYKKELVSELKWGDLEYKEYTFATTTHVYKKSGETVAYLSEGLPNLELLKKTIKEGRT